MTFSTKNTISFQEQFDALMHRNSASPWLKGIREQGFQKFSSLGFPTKREEEWRFIDISEITKTNFNLPSPVNTSLSKKKISPYSFGELDCYSLVFIDGQFHPQHSSNTNLPQGVIVDEFSLISENQPLIKDHLLRHSRKDKNAFTALNDAFLNQVAIVHISPKVTLKKPIHLLYLSTDMKDSFAVHPRNVILAENGSNFTVVESYIGMGNNRYLTNSVTDVIVDETASVNHIKIQREGTEAFHVGHLNEIQKKDSSFASISVTVGAKLTRNKINANLEDSGCECILDGLYLGTKNQTIANHTRIDHAMPHCNSHELYKGILDDNSSAVFNGKIYVHPDAQKTDAKQTNRVLLLSDDAKINTKPELEIFADDVKCTHGATVGQLDEEALFYLRSRGIPRRKAHSLLTYAFAAEAIEKVNIAQVKTEIEDILNVHFK